MDPRPLRKTAITLVAVALTGAARATSALAGHVPGATPREAGHVARLVFPIMNPERGKQLFVNKGCVACHVVNGIGKEVGPNLSEIGGKLSRLAFYDSILFPSAGISHNYETYTLVLESGNVVSGVLTSRTPDSVTIKDAEAIVRTFKTSEIELIKKESTSLMPADIQKLMTAKELVDVVEYLTTLKKKKSSKK